MSNSAFQPERFVATWKHRVTGRNRNLHGSVLHRQIEPGNEVGERPDSELDEVVDESRESENGETIAFGSLVSAGISPASRFGRGVSCMGRAPQQAPASIIISCVSPTHEFFPKLVLESGSSRIRFPVATKIALHSAGINGGTPGSPTPAGGASLSTR